MKRKDLLALASGLIFSLGLGVGGMTSANKVKAFLDVLGHWDPSLICVMGAGIAVAFWAFRWAKRARAPKFGGDFGWPTAKQIDSRLVFGAVLFGIGWGLVGYCPGPALVALGAGRSDALFVFLGMAVGILVVKLAESQTVSPRKSAASHAGSTSA